MAKYNLAEALRRAEAMAKNGGEGVPDPKIPISTQEGYTGNTGNTGNTELKNNLGSTGHTGVDPSQKNKFMGYTPYTPGERVSMMRKVTSDKIYQYALDWGCNKWRLVDLIERYGESQVKEFIIKAANKHPGYFDPKRDLNASRGGFFTYILTNDGVPRFTEDQYQQIVEARKQNRRTF